MSPDIDPRASAAYRAARLAVIVLSVLIVLAVIALVVGAVVKLAHKPAARGGEAGTAFQLPPGAQIVETQSQPGRLILRVRRGGEEEIDILDTRDGHLVTRIKAGAPEHR